MGNHQSWSVSGVLGSVMSTGHSCHSVSSFANMVYTCKREVLVPSTRVLCGQDRTAVAHSASLSGATKCVRPYRNAAWHATYNTPRAACNMHISTLQHSALQRWPRLFGRLSAPPSGGVCVFLASSLSLRIPSRTPAYDSRMPPLYFTARPRVCSGAASSYTRSRLGPAISVCWSSRRPSTLSVQHATASCCGLHATPSHTRIWPIVSSGNAQ